MHLEKTGDNVAYRENTESEILKKFIMYQIHSRP